MRKTSIYLSYPQPAGLARLHPAPLWFKILEAGLRCPLDYPGSCHACLLSYPYHCPYHGQELYKGDYLCYVNPVQISSSFWFKPTPESA